MQVEKLDAGLSPGAEGTFQILLVKQGRELAGIEGVIGCLMQAPFFGQIIADGLVAQRPQAAIVLGQFRQIGEHIVLADLMGQQGNLQAFQAVGIVADRVGPGLVEESLAAHPAALRLLRDEIVVGPPRQPAAGGEGKGGAGVLRPRIDGTQMLDQLVHRFQVAAQLVAQRKEGKGGMVGVLAQHPFALEAEPGIDCRFLAHREAPVGQLDLQAETMPVGNGKGGLRGTPGMEAQMVEPVFLRGAEDLLPASLVHRRIAGFREDAAFQRPAQKGFAPVHGELGPFGADRPHPERGGDDQSILQRGLQPVEIGGEFRPWPEFLSHRINQFDHPFLPADFIGTGGRWRFGTVMVDRDCPHRDLAGGRLAGPVRQRDPNRCGSLFRLRIHPQAIDVNRGECLQLDAADHAVPDRLRLVGIGMPDADIELAAVVDTDGDGVLARLEKRGEIMDMRRGQGILHAGLLAIAPDPGLPDHPFQKQLNLPALPIFRHNDGFHIPGRPRVFEALMQMLERFLGQRRLQRQRRPQAGAGGGARQLDAAGQWPRHPRVLDAGILRIKLETPFAGQIQAALAIRRRRQAAQHQHRQQKNTETRQHNGDPFPGSVSQSHRPNSITVNNS